MRIIPEYIDKEINILIIKILLTISFLNSLHQITLLAAIIIFVSSFLPLYINITNMENNISFNQQYVLKCSFIISIITIAHYSIHLYLNNRSEFFFIFGLFSLIYNLITERVYQSYMSKFVNISERTDNRKYTKVKNNNGELSCCICMDTDTDINFVKTSCGHHYHDKCIQQWEKVQSNCPICRKTIK